MRLESGNGVRVRANGVEITGPVSGDGSVLKRLQWESLLNCPQSLSGYNIAVVTQSVFNEGKDDSAPVTTKKLFNGIFKAIGYTLYGRAVALVKRRSTRCISAFLPSCSGTR